MSSSPDNQHFRSEREKCSKFKTFTINEQNISGLDEDLDRVSLSSPPSELPGMRRQGSKVSYGSNDSNGSSNSANILKVREK